MKFQNPSFKFFFERTDKRTNTQKDKRTSRKQYAPHFFKVGGIIRVMSVKLQFAIFQKRFPDAFST